MVRAGVIFGRILGWFGLQWAVNEYGVEPMLDWVRQLMAQGPGGDLGPKVMAWAGVLRLDVAVSMLLSAYVAVWSIKSVKAFLTKAE